MTEDPVERASAGAPARPRGAAYPLFMLGLSVFVLAALAAQTFLDLRPETERILELADFAICFVFLLDFLRSLYLADNRFRYLVTWGWLDLLSSIPAVDALRWGRAARIVRILRLLRGLRATRSLMALAFVNRAKSVCLSVTLIAILAIVFSSIAILHLERGTAGANIATAEDALWWAFVTVTTVGYGDYYPVTTAGRLLATFLMLIGISLFGTITASIASAFLAPGEEQQEGEMAAMRQEIAALRQVLEERTDREPG